MSALSQVGLWMIGITCLIAFLVAGLYDGKPGIDYPYPMLARLITVCGTIIGSMFFLLGLLI